MISELTITFINVFLIILTASLSICTIATTLNYLITNIIPRIGYSISLYFENVKEVDMIDKE